MSSNPGAPAIGRRPLFRSLRAPVLGVLLAALGGAEAAQAQEPTLHTYRFWRDPDLTLVEVVAGIPWSALSFQTADGLETAAYTARFQVRDTAGNVLTTQEWQDTVRTPALTPESRARASTAETFQLHLKPGRYVFALEVGDGGGSPARVETTVVAPAAKPAHSDLVIAAALQRADTAVSPAGAIVRGDLAAVPNAGGAITSEKPEIGLFAEVYRPSVEPETAQAVVSIDGVGRAFQHRTQPQRRIIPAGGGVEALGVNLAGLPPGDYRVSLQWAFGPDTIRVSHPLRMLPPGAGEVQLAAELPYEDFTSEQLDSIFAPMVYIADAGEEVDFNALESAAAKRRFLARFWQRRAAATGESAEELRQDWDEAVAYANLNFRPPRPGQRGMMGWQTDRGRIYLTLGRPAETYVERQRQDQTNPWEVWKYIGGRGDKYVFWDQTGFGDYILVWTTNPDVRTLPGWERYFTEEALRIIRTF